VTTQDKIEYIRSFMTLITKAESYHSAISHASFVRGMLAMCFRDQTIPLEDYSVLSQDVETMMEVKRNMPSAIDRELF